MVRKLIADEFRSIWRQWRSILLPAGIVLIVSLIMVAANMPILSGLGQFASVLAVIAIIASVFILPMVNYYRKLYGNQGYLTMTLPATSSELYWSRFITGGLWSLIGIGTIAVIAILFSLSSDIMVRQALFTSFLSFWRALSSWDGPWYVIPLIVGGLLLAICGTVAQYSFIISKGSEACFHSMGRAAGIVIMYIITYLLQQIVSLAGMLYIPIGLRLSLSSDGETISGVRLVAESSLDSMLDAIRGVESQSVTLGLGFILLMLLLYATYVVLTIRSLERHTSLR